MYKHFKSGVHSTAVVWLNSYLIGRHSYFKLRDGQSTNVSSSFDVTQSSLLSPTLFWIYITQSWILFLLLESAYIHPYTDNNQLYIAVDRNEKNYNMDALERCSAAISDWMLHNGLAFNPDTSEVIMFETSQAIAMSTTSNVLVAVCNITMIDKVKTFSVILDKCLTFYSRVQATCKAIYYHEWALRNIWLSLPDTLAKTVESAIISRLDYCNSLLDDS